LFDSGEGVACRPGSSTAAARCGRRVPSSGRHHHPLL